MTVALCLKLCCQLYLVSCSELTNPDNGVINCSLGDDGVPFYEDTCSFTCNTGYELTGSDTRTCHINGSWSGSDAACQRGEYHRLMHYSYIVCEFKPGMHLVFFKIALSVCVHVCCVCVSLCLCICLCLSVFLCPLLMVSSIIWHDMDPYDWL